MFNIPFGTNHAEIIDPFQSKVIEIGCPTLGISAETDPESHQRPNQERRGNNEFKTIQIRTVIRNA
jgi:hypothetical protein